MRTFLRALIPFPLLLLASFAQVDEEIVKEFRRYFKKYKDTATRVEAILALEGNETPSVVGVLIPVLKDPDGEVVRAAIRVLAGFETRPPIDAIIAGLEDENQEGVLVGLLAAIEQGAYTGASEPLIELLEHTDWPLRRAALKALLASEGAARAPAVLPLVDDREPAVRCAALDALAGVRAEAVVPAGIGRLADESWQVRASAVAALSRVRHRDSIGPLIERLEVEEGRLQEDVGHALDEITGRGFGRRLELWKRFWESYRDVYEIPSDAELARLRAVQKEREEAYDGPGKGLTYHGIETPSRAIVFVIDTSGSMEQEVVERERYSSGGYPSFKRIDIVKTELARTIEGLESYVKFNILAFATEVDPWKKGLVKANPLNKSSALSFVERLEAIGGNSKEGLAQAGLVGTANLEGGKTNTHAALMQALGFGGKSDDYEVEVDTIFFLSDGRPSTGTLIDPDDVLAEVLRENELRKIVIHTLGIGEFEKDFMFRLATENGGIYVDLGK